MNKSVLVLLLFAATHLAADEGMWQPHQVSMMSEWLKTKGLQIEAGQLADLSQAPFNAILELDGCSGSFVSPQGLVLTNHHCVLSSLQHQSQLQHNRVEQGFLAKNLAQELPAAPSTRLYITTDMTNVTRQINQELTPQLLGKERFETITQVQKELIAECESAPHIRCRVHTVDGGLEYHLIKQFEIRDVRLVYAPAATVGNFGGEIDNWMWPRHSGDFAFLRAYVGPDGQPADYASDNIPFTPPAFLKVSARGIVEHDFVMVAGYPMATTRYLSAEQIKLKFTAELPQTEVFLTELVALIETHTAANPESHLRYQTQLAKLKNHLQYTQGMRRAYQKGDLLQRKEHFEKVIQQWLKGDASRQVRFAPAIKQLHQLTLQQSMVLQRDLVVEFLRQAQGLMLATQLYRWSWAQQQPEQFRPLGYQQKDEGQLKDWVKNLSATWVPAVDLDIALHFMRHYHQLPKPQRLPALDAFFGLNAGVAMDDAALRKRLESVYASPLLTDEIERLAWLGKPVEAFQQSTDPLLQFAVMMHDVDTVLAQEHDDLKGKLAVVLPQVRSAHRIFNQTQQKHDYADANGTLRVSFGTVQGYQPKDAVMFSPFTTAKGILEKAGEGPFAAPAAQLKQLAHGDFQGYLHPVLQTLPINFLSNSDTTGGHSGSATLNAQGELVGVLFDGVQESLIGDLDYDPKLNRSIHVDSRYLLWQMEKVDGAGHLLQEMTVVR